MVHDRERIHTRGREKEIEPFLQSEFSTLFYVSRPFLLLFALLSDSLNLSDHFVSLLQLRSARFSQRIRLGVSLWH